MSEAVVDLNADLGEGYGPYTLGADADMMPIVSSASIACGLHAGDPVIMRRTVREALQHDTAVGAHVGYPDLWGFGRRPVQLSKDELHCFLLYQLGSLEGFLRAEGASMQHVKPHGILYNEAARDESLSTLICDVIHSFDAELILFAPAGSITADVARQKGLRVAEEGFADRGYTPQGTLVPRGQMGAVIEDVRQVSERAAELARGQVLSSDGSLLELKIDTICLHGDTPNAAGFARAIRAELDAAEIEVRPVSTFLKESSSGRRHS